MKIYGFQKLTLLDYPGELACTIFTGGCNFRCPYCHNEPFILPAPTLPPLDETQLFLELKNRKKLLTGVCISGGEPTLHTDLIEWIKKIKDLGYLVKLDTNGSNPNLLSYLIQENLIDYIAMDIKNCLSAYPSTIGLEIFDEQAIKKSAALLLQSQVSYEFRTTLVSNFHRKEEITEISFWLKGAEKYYLQPYQDSPNVNGHGLYAPKKEALLEFQSILQNTIKQVFIRTEI